MTTPHFHVLYTDVARAELRQLSALVPGSPPALLLKL